MAFLPPLHALSLILHGENKPAAPITLDPAFAAQLKDIAQEVRTFLEPRWREIHLISEKDFSVASAGMCVISSRFLQEILATREIEASFRYGKSCDNRGFFSGDKWWNHGWAEIGNAIVDITPDQFGEQPIIITTIADPRYRRGRGGYILDNTGSRILQAWLGEWKKFQLLTTLPSPMAAGEKGPLLSHRA